MKYLTYNSYAIVYQRLSVVIFRVEIFVSYHTKSAILVYCVYTQLQLIVSKEKATD